MIPYVTRRGWRRKRRRRRGYSPDQPSLPARHSSPVSNQQSDVVCFTSATPKWTAEYPPSPRSIFFHPRGSRWPTRGGLRDGGPRLAKRCHHRRDLGHAQLRGVQGEGEGYLRGVCYFFPPSSCLLRCRGTETETTTQGLVVALSVLSLYPPPFPSRNPLLISFHPLVHTDPSHPYLSRGCSVEVKDGGMEGRRERRGDARRVPRIFSSGARLSVLVDDVIRV